MVFIPILELVISLKVIFARLINEDILGSFIPSLCSKKAALWERYNQKFTMIPLQALITKL